MKRTVSTVISYEKFKCLDKVRKDMNCSMSDVLRIAIDDFVDKQLKYLTKPIGNVSVSISPYAFDILNEMSKERNSTHTSTANTAIELYYKMKKVLDEYELEE